MPPGRISAIVNGKRSITANTALRLSRYFEVSSELWLGLQTEYDLRVARRLVGAEIEKRVHHAIHGFTNGDHRDKLSPAVLPPHRGLSFV